MSTFDVSNAGFNPNLRRLEPTDRAHADVFNELFGQLINNDVAIMEAASGMFATKNAQAAFLLNLHKDGKKYGVHFDDFAINPSPIGTRLHDAAGMVAYPSTDTVRAQNDFEGVSVFYHIEVNGYVDGDGEFQVQYIRGIDNEFSLTDADVWCLFLPQWISITIDAYGENKILSDTRFDGSFVEGGAIRPDGSIRPFVAIAKYQDSAGSSSEPNSVSGAAPSYDNSHNSLITKMRRKGEDNQYCATSFQDVERMNNLMDVAFATRNSQSIMYGAYNYYLQYPATVVETGVEHIVISKANAANLVVGSCVSIGNATSLNGAGTAGNIDRGQAGMHAKANRVKILSIEEYDANNSVVTVDNGGSTFSTASTTVSGVECPTYLSTMPWFTGSTDGVLGACGSPNSNSNGKNPYLLFGVEFALGQYEVCGNAIMNIVNGVMTPYVCYDATDISSSAPTADYEEVGYTVALTDNTWKYISVLGFDADNPMARYGTAVDATSSTGYADGQHTGSVDATTNAKREILLFGGLGGAATAGRRYAYLSFTLGNAYWVYGARLSASGRCAQAAA